MSEAREPGAVSLEIFRHLLDRLLDPDLASIEVRQGAVVVTPKGPGTFPVTLYDQGEEAMVAAERWHAHYDEPDQAAFAALWLLTPYYRVVHELRGGILAAVWIERWTAEGWDAMEPVYFLNPDYAPDWDPAAGHAFHQRSYQQAVALPPKDYEEIEPGVVLGDDRLPPGSMLGSVVRAVEQPLGPMLAK